jgi:hypothetical protein
MEEVIRDLKRLAGYAAGLQELMAELEQAAPARIEGVDRSGSVQAVLGRDGLPEVIRVQSGWSDRLDARSFASAVTDSCGAAARQRGLAWSQALEQSGWQRRAAELHSDGARTPTVTPGAVPPAFMRADVRPRPIDQLAEETMALGAEVMNAAGGARARRQERTRPGTGSNRTRTVTLTLAPGGQVSCQADPRWVTGKSGGQLTEALTEALATAREALAESSSSETTAGRPSDVGSRQERLLAEILAALNNPQRFM